LCATYVVNCAIVWHGCPASDCRKTEFFFLFYA
jgi:hypothetical protein